MAGGWYVDIPVATIKRIRARNAVRCVIAGPAGHGLRTMRLTHARVGLICARITQYDLRLYKVGEELFEQQLARMPPSFPAELAAFRASLAAYRTGQPTCVDCLGGSTTPAGPGHAP